VLALPNKLPRRTDWSFEYTCQKDDTHTDTVNTNANDGLDLRVRGVVSGSKINTNNDDEDDHNIQLELLSLSQYVKPPEDWLRSLRGNRKVIELVQAISSLCTTFAFIVGMGLALLRWSKADKYKLFKSKTVSMIFILYSLNVALREANGCYAFMYSVSTAKPLTTQMFSKLATILVRCVTFGGVFGLNFGLIESLDFRKKQTLSKPNLGTCMAAISFGILTPSLQYALLRVFTQMGHGDIERGTMEGGTLGLPHLVDTSSLSQALPFGQIVLNVCVGYLQYVIGLMLSFGALFYIDGYGRLGFGFRLVATCAVFGAMLAGSSSLVEIVSVNHFLGLAVAMWVLVLFGYLTCFRHHANLIPLTLASWFSTVIVQSLLSVWIATREDGLSLFLGEPCWQMVMGYFCSVCLVWTFSMRMFARLKPVG